MTHVTTPDHTTLCGARDATITLSLDVALRLYRSDELGKYVDCLFCCAAVRAHVSEQRKAVGNG